MMLHAMLLGWALQVPPPAPACGFTLQCGSSFSVDALSPSGDCLEDDMRLTLRVEGKAAALREIPPAWYQDLPLTGDLPSTCTSTGGAPAPVFVAGPRALLFLRANGRPGHDRLSAVLLEVRRMRVLHRLDLGDTRQPSIEVLRSGEGFKVRVIKTFRKEANCDCDAAFVDGWLHLGITGDKIRKRWL